MWQLVRLSGVAVVAVVAIGCVSGSSDSGDVAELAGQVTPHAHANESNGVERGDAQDTVKSPEPTPADVALTPHPSPARVPVRAPAAWPSAFDSFDIVRSRAIELGFDGAWSREPYELAMRLRASDDWDRRHDVVVALHDGATPASGVRRETIDGVEIGVDEVVAPGMPGAVALDGPTRVVWVECEPGWLTVAEANYGEWELTSLEALASSFGDDNCGRDRELLSGGFAPDEMPMNLDDERVLLRRFEQARWVATVLDGVARFENWREPGHDFRYDLGAAEARRWPFDEVPAELDELSDRDAGTSVLDRTGVTVINSSDGAEIRDVVEVPGSGIRLGVRDRDFAAIEGYGPVTDWVVDRFDDDLDEFVDAVRDPTAHYFTGPPAFGPDGLIVWGIYSEFGTALYAARINDDGFLVDVHDVDVQSSSPLAPGPVHASWYGIDSDGVLLAVGSQREMSHNGGGGGGYLPNHGWFDLTTSVGWAISAPTQPVVDSQPFVEFADGTTWHVSTDPGSVDNDCGTYGLFFDSPDGPVRVGPPGAGFERVGEPAVRSAGRGTTSEWLVATLTCGDEPDRTHVVLVERRQDQRITMLVSRCPVLALDGVEPPSPFTDIGPLPFAIAVTTTVGEERFDQYLDFVPFTSDWPHGSEPCRSPSSAAPPLPSPTIEHQLARAVEKAIASRGFVVTEMHPVDEGSPVRMLFVRDGTNEPTLMVTIHSSVHRPLDVDRHVVSIRDGFLVAEPLLSRQRLQWPSAAVIHFACGDRLATLTSVGGVGEPLTDDELVEVLPAIDAGCR